MEGKKRCKLGFNNKNPRLGYYPDMDILANRRELERPSEERCQNKFLAP
jgi:hypothetical protein